ncbi:MAG: 16S rRNA (cytidine(1402)-2'-O)-methyltransferase [Clostridiales bacterium]|nr:16S rRNA (cytidine(1402)-2'-O)-methyltransferase [Clostridiales bacterium]
MTDEINRGSGTLYITGTPIGNLEDITMRALRILGVVDIVAAEDTRRTRALLTHFGLSRKLVSYHEHNRREAGERLLAELAKGRDVALVTDAGMPCVSDPGWELVRDARQIGIPVTVVPGPAALTAAAALSGLDAGRFVFEGFLPRERREREQRLRAMAAQDRAIVLYEAPHRLARTLADLLDALGDRCAALCGELTKMHERVTVERLSALSDMFAQQEPRGEYVLVIEGQQVREPAPEWKALTLEQHIRVMMATGLQKKEAVREVARLRGIPKSQVYEAGLSIRAGSDEQ